MSYAHLKIGGEGSGGGGRRVGGEGGGGEGGGGPWEEAFVFVRAQSSQWVAPQGEADGWAGGRGYRV